METPDVILVSHGSPHDGPNREFLAFRDELRGRRPDWRIEAGFLERAEPEFGGLLEGMIRKGARSLVVVPCLLFPGGHASGDLPRLIEAAVSAHPGVRIRRAPTLSETADLPGLLLRPIPAADLERPGLRLLLAAAGSTAQANRRRLERLAGEVEALAGRPVRFAYLDQGEPRLADQLVASADGAGRIVVLPCLLFRGLYAGRLASVVQEFRLGRPGLPVDLTEPLGLDGRLAEAVERAAEARARDREG